MNLIDKIQQAQVSAGEQAVIENLKSMGFLEDDKPTPLWTLISPNGVEFKAETALKCFRKEQEARIPKEVRLERIEEFLSGCVLCEEKEKTYTLAKGTPAEIEVCLTCKNTLLAERENR